MGTIVGRCAKPGVIAFVAAACIACGPIEYVNQVTRKASSDVEAAEAVKNDEDATFVYWFTLAREYLIKAREEASYADFQAANRFGRKASFAAKKAKESALQSAADPSTMVRTPGVDEDATPVDSDSDSDGFSDVDGTDDGGDDEEPPPGMESP